jgi:hypothetical protein
MTIQDGHEVLDTSTIGGGVQAARPMSERLSRRQRMTMTPEILILASASAPDVGTRLNEYSENFFSALTQDDELLALVGIDPQTKTGLGDIRYEGCVLEPAVAGSQLRRLLVTITFTYLYRAA